MNDLTIAGRVLRSSTTGFTIGCQQVIAEQSRTAPEFGALVKALNRDGSVTYGLVYNVTVEDDPFVRQLVAAGVEDEEFIADQRQRRQVPVAVDVLVVGHGRPTTPDSTIMDVYYRLPAQPPGTLDQIYTCNNAEVRRFTGRHDWLRTALNSADTPADQLIVAALRAGAASRPSEQERDAYLIAAGRELARLLALDLTRLDGILRQLQA
jgi:hypothetical protein